MDTTQIKKGSRFTTQFGRTYEVVRVMPKSQQATVQDVSNHYAPATNWRLSEVARIIAAYHQTAASDFPV